MSGTVYICPDCRSELNAEKQGLHCAKGHFFAFIEGTNVPIFASEDANVNEYTTTEAGEIHDNSLKWLFATFGGSEAKLRENLVARLRLQPGNKVLVTGVGAGNDLPYLARLIGKRGEIYAQDYSIQMLLAAMERSEKLYHLAACRIEFSAGDATNLPYPDNYFDAAYHFGGINLFSSIGKGITEMDRVVKHGGRVVFGDEGLAPWLRDTEYGKMIINNNPLCHFEPPLKELPATARDAILSWDVGYCFYIIEYTVSESPLPIDIDVKHVGKRGGSMKTRYFGTLEGIDPDLKKKLYAEAEKKGISRVEYIESLLHKGLEHDC